MQGSPYLLKIILRAEDPSRHYVSMKAAADAGLAPRVWYAHVEDKVSITDFVKAEPLPISEALVRLPAVLRTLHALPSFVRAPFNTTCKFLLNRGQVLDGFLSKFRADDILPKAKSDEFFSCNEEVAAVYPYDDTEIASSHNDLFKPDNILFDGQRVLLVDWEAAFLNDRYADLVVVANQIVTSAAEERAYLEAYFGASPDEYQLARFFLMQQVARIFYVMAYLSQGPSGRPIDWSEPLPDCLDVYRRSWAGGIDLADKMKIVYGRVHLEQLLQNVRHARFHEAPRIVGDRHGIRQAFCGDDHPATK